MIKRPEDRVMFRNGRSALALALALACPISAGAAKPPMFDTGREAYERHIAKATEGMPASKKAALEAQCSAAVAPRPLGPTGSPPAAEIEAARLPPTQVFDNLYFVGDKDVSVWALQTSKGLILLDATHVDRVE